MFNEMPLPCQNLGHNIYYIIINLLSEFVMNICLYGSVNFHSKGNNNR